MLVDNPLDTRPNDWSPDGKCLLHSVNHEETGWDLWYLKRKEDGSGFEPVPYLQTSFGERAAKFSRTAVLSPMSRMSRAETKSTFGRFRG